jgi:glycolate oxidase FAD binding subunit
MGSLCFNKELYSSGLRIEPTTPKELSEALAGASANGKRISLGGRFSKGLMGGPTAEADVTISTASMNRILQYEPADLTLSVEAGTPWAALCLVLDRNHQMIPLDPPFGGVATVGGVIATNGSGPRRRLYGTARDLVIGMRFATLDGKEVQSGGMVVKNVAGLDMGKLMIGSFGTLAAISVVNFKLTPKPDIEKTALLQFESLDEAIEARDRLIRGVLQPAAVDLLNPMVLGEKANTLAVQFGGNAAVVARYARELGGTLLEEEAQERFWNGVIEYPRHFMERYPKGAVVRVVSTLTDVKDVMASLQVPAIARAANGVTYAHFAKVGAAVGWIQSVRERPWKCVIDYSQQADKQSTELWPAPGDDFGMMKSIKRMFDPQDLLNHGRLYRLI